MHLDGKMPRTLALKAARPAIISLTVAGSFIIIDQRAAPAADLILVCDGRQNAIHPVYGKTSAGIPTKNTYVIDLDRSMAWDDAKSGQGYAAKINEQRIFWCRKSNDCVDVNRITGDIIDEYKGKTGSSMRFSGTCKKSEGKQF
jgi:hypothetical protein